MDTPLRPANMPAEPENPSFASAKERAAEASKQLQVVVNDYPHTHSAEFARYFWGVTAINLGDDAGRHAAISRCCRLLQRKPLGPRQNGAGLALPQPASGPASH